MSVIRRYHIEQGAAMNYSRRLIASDILAANRREQRFTKYGVGTPAAGGVADRVRQMAEPGADNVLVNTVQLFGRHYAATELPQVTEYCPATLATLGKVDLAARIPGLVLLTPHPLYEEDGTMWNIAIAAGPDTGGNLSAVWRYVIFKVGPPKTAEEERDPWQNLEVVGEKSSSRPISISYHHSFFMTARYIIFTEQPWIFGSLPSMLYRHVWQGRPLGEAMYWDEDATLRFHVMEKATGKFVATNYEADAMGFYHIINAYEEDNCLVLDAPFVVQPMSYNVLTRQELAGDPDTLRRHLVTLGGTGGLMARRWVLPLTVPDTFSPPSLLQLTEDGSVSPHSYPSLLAPGGHVAAAWHVAPGTVYLQPELLAPAEQYEYHRELEFPAINPNFAGKKYRSVSVYRSHFWKQSSN